MDLQRADIAVVEHRVSADLDVVGTGRRVGDDTVRLEYTDGLFSLTEHLVQAMLEYFHGLLGGKVLRLVLQVTQAIDVVQVVGEHQAQIGQGRVTGMKSIGCGAVELLGDQPEILGAARFKHAHHHAVLLAHASHDLPDRVELAKLARNVTLDVLKLKLHRTGVKGQWST